MPPEPTPTSLELLESALKEALSRLQALSAENVRLRDELAERGERMRLAGSKLRVVAERLPRPAEASSERGLDAAKAAVLTTQIKAA
ncbi:MAG: hypothetical protein IT523_03785 [Burkholderiales bacterium]|nr:hypothetical protein [Burkholderiales bacterium]